MWFTDDKVAAIVGWKGRGAFLNRSLLINRLCAAVSTSWNPLLLPFFSGPPPEVWNSVILNLRYVLACDGRNQINMKPTNGATMLSVQSSCSHVTTCHVTFTLTVYTTATKRKSSAVQTLSRTKLLGKWTLEQTSDETNDLKWNIWPICQHGRGGAYELHCSQRRFGVTRRKLSCSFSYISTSWTWMTDFCLCCRK